ncbi:hypothetical protein Tco_0285295 [Tanacetum coccineum]
MNEDYYHEQSSCYDPNSFGFDQFQPPQYTVNHPIFNAQNTLLNAQNELLNAQNKLMEKMTSICDMVGQIMQKKEEEKRIAEEQAAKDRYRKIPFATLMTMMKKDPSFKNILLSGLPPYDILREKLLNVNLFIAKIKALKDNPTPSSDVMTKSSSTSPNFFLEETNTVDNSLPKLKLFFKTGEINSTINVVEDIPVDVPNILPTHPALQLDFDFIPSNDLGSDLDVSSPSGDRNKIYDPGICIEFKSTRFLATLSPVINTLLPFSSENKDKVFNHGVLASKEKSPPSSSHRGFKASKPFHHKSPMLIHGDNTPNMGVRHPHFYPP